nr:SMI1/KNR4 family protein [uncultured Flavobacterium sp.]
MDFDFVKKIIEENKSKVEFAEFGEGVSDEWLQKAQLRLNVKFPPSYVWWLKNYNGGEINGEEIFSIYEMDFDSVVGGDIVYINELNRKNGTSTVEQLVIQENDMGESYYFNLLEIDPNGEYPVYNDLTEEKYADNFLDFIVKIIQE